MLMINKYLTINKYVTTWLRTEYLSKDTKKYMYE
jgi:hypothetical protein